MKFSPAGSEVDVETSQSRPEYVSLTVRDRGHGIVPERRPDLLERFARLNSDRDFGGLGVSLYDSRSIVELHGGQIRVEAPDGGTCFVSELPLAPNDANQQNA